MVKKKLKKKVNIIKIIKKVKKVKKVGKVKRPLRAVKSKKKVIKREKFSGKILCYCCKKQIMYKDICVSYFDSLTKERRMYHFKCQFKDGK